MSWIWWPRYLRATGATLIVAFVASTAISVWRIVTVPSDRLALYEVVPALFGLLFAVWVLLAGCASCIARIGVAWRMRWDAIRGGDPSEPRPGLLSLVAGHVFVFVFVDLAMLFCLAVLAGVLLLCLGAIVSVSWTGHYSE